MPVVRTRSLRIVAGEFRGRRIEAPRGSAIRPTSERVREAVFSILGDVSGARVLDLFAGTGALGIEALSRGAAHATFVDDAEAAAAVISLNRDRLGLTDRGTVVRADLRVGPLPLGHGPYDLVLIDPPYGEAADLGLLLAPRLPGALAPGARVVTESDRRTPLDLGVPPTLERRYGDTLIRIYKFEKT
jgi:16S rRNA (guanine966-N2)-methyltransferase